MIVQDSKDLPNVFHVDSHRHLKCKLLDGVVMAILKAKNIYKIIDHNKDIIEHTNSIWYSSFEEYVQKKYFDFMWKSPIERKIRCLKWLVMLGRLPVKRYHAYSEICSLCRLPKTGRHILFDCTFAKRFGTCLVSFILLMRIFWTFFLVILLVFIKIQIHSTIYYPLTFSDRSGS